uniref:Uncharacterized protein n=1 Tax=Anopheles coluzzii TaxID=1518534 RepID=A0A8W7PCT4_ANOCL
MTIELTLAACQAPVGDGKPTLASLAETLVDGLAQPSAVQSVPVAYLALGHWYWGKRAEAAYSNRTLSKRLVEIVPAGERIASTGCILAQEIVSYWPDEWNTTYETEYVRASSPFSRKILQEEFGSGEQEKMSNTDYSLKGNKHHQKQDKNSGDIVKAEAGSDLTMLHYCKMQQPHGSPLGAHFVLVPSALDGTKERASKQQA